MWRSPKAAQTELELAGSPAVFPAQHLRLYHHNFPVQIILMGNGNAALRRDGAVVYALYAGLVEFYVGFLRLLGNPLAEQLHNLREIITGHHFAIFCKQCVLPAKGAHILHAGFILWIFPQDNLPVANLHRLDNLIITGHAFFCGIIVHHSASNSCLINTLISFTLAKSRSFPVR